MNVFNHFMKLKYANLILLVGVAVGFTVAVGFLPGGFDAYFSYLKTYPNSTPVPAWIFLLTTPLSLLGPPYSWQALTFITMLAAGFAAWVWGNKHWWVAVFSAPMLWNIWLGQIEGLLLLGLLVGGLVIQKRAHPAWLGFAWLVLIVKPQVGLGMILLLTWWLWRDQGLKAVLYSVLSAGVIIAFTSFLWPDWPLRWVHNMQVIQYNQNVVASIWPFGLLAIPLALIPKNVSRIKRLRMVAAATLLVSPYLMFYHSTTLLALVASPLALALSWLLVLPSRFLPDTWMQWGWILPAAILLVDFVRCYTPVKNLAVDAA